MIDVMSASRQWATRPADERFTNLVDLHAHVKNRHERATERVIPNRHIQIRPVEEDETRRGLAVSAAGVIALPTHHAFNQLAGLVPAPARYLRSLPSDLVADCINYGMARRGVEEVGAMFISDPVGDLPELACATGPNYGRVWNDKVTGKLMELFGDGTTGRFKVPGEFKRAVTVDKGNTTLYASDRDMFVFLADEANRIELPDRRNGQPGTLARGFIVWNSEVGTQTLGVATFLFDEVCYNRIIWGMDELAEIRIRHTSGAPLRFLEEIAPALEIYAEGATTNILTAIENARQKRMNDPEKLDEFLKSRFTKGQTAGIKLSFLSDEDRPIENLWDVVTGVTAYARGIGNQDDRVDIERKAGAILALASR